MASGDVTRQRLLRAALELFTTRGYHPTTTPLIAKKTGVAEGTIYRHVASKEQLFNDLFRGAARWASEQLAAADGASQPPRDKLDAFARVLVACAARDPGVIRILFLMDSRDLLDERSREAWRGLRQGVEQVVAQGKAVGAVRPGAADLWAGVWLATLRYALERVCDREWTEDHASVGDVIGAAWRAIAADAA